MELARCAICGEEHPPAEMVTLRNEAEDAPAGARGEFPAARWRRVPDDELTGERRVVSADLDEQEVGLRRKRFHSCVGQEPREEGPRLGRLAAPLFDLLRVR